MSGMTGRATLHIAAFTQIASSSIVCLGDNLTHGVSLTYPAGEDGGYRSQLAALLVAGDYVTSQVGSIADGPTTATNHEGWNGFGIGGTGLAPSDIQSKGVVAMTAYAPAFCLVMGGTNDLLQPWSTAAMRATMATRMGAALDAMHAASPSTFFIVATCTPIDPVQYVVHVIDGLTPTDTERTNYNAALPGIVASRSAWAASVDPAGSMTLADISDQVHPNAVGYGKIAAAYYTPLAARMTAQAAAPTSYGMFGVASVSQMTGRVSLSRMTGRATARSG